MTHAVRDGDDLNDNSQTLGHSSRRVHNGRSLDLRAVPSRCMSGTLGDVFLFRSNGGCSVGTADEESGEMSSEEHDGGFSNNLHKNSSNNNIEWQQLLKDGVKANAGNRPKFGDSDRSRFPVLGQQKFHFMVPGGRGAGGPWDSPRVEDHSRAVNYLQSFGPVPSGSSGGSVDGQLGDFRLALDGHEQMLTDHVLRRSTSTAEVTGGSRDEEEFGGAVDSPSTISSHILQGGIISSSAQQQQLFSPRGLGMPSTASIQQLTRSPNHAIRNLFPEKSSNFSSAVLQSHEELGVNKVVDEQVLLHLPKKSRRQDYGDGVSLSSPLCRVEAEHAKNLNHGSTSGHYRKASFSHDQRSNSLASFIDSSYSKSPTTSFSASYPPADRSTAFNSISSLQNPSTSLSFHTSGGPLPPLKNSAHEGMSIKSPLVEYGSYGLDSNRMQNGGGFRGELLAPDRDSFLDAVSSPPCGRNYISLVGSLGQGPFNFSSRRPSSLDTGCRAAWPAGLINNIPSLSIDNSSGTSLSSRRALHDPEQDGVLDDREARRIHSISESRRRLLIQKQLTITDVGSLGRIILPKKEAETHLPQLPDKEGIEMFMYDYEADRTWTMKYRFWPNNKSRMYLLENTGEFAKFHSLQQGDWLYIYREPVARYVLRAKKTPPLVQVTPSSQSVTEPATPATGGPPPAEEVGGPASASGRTMNQSSSPASTTGGGGGSSVSTEMVSGTTTGASGNQLSLDVPYSPHSLSGGGAGGTKHTGKVGGEAEKHAPPHRHHHDQLIFETLSKQQHSDQQLQPAPGAAAAVKSAMVDDHHHHEHDQDHRLKNYMAVQQQQQQDHEMQSELDGGGDFNLEDFPRLIEADDEIIENILGQSDSHVSGDLRSRPHSFEGRSVT